MSNVLRTALAVVLALSGLALAAVFVINAVHGANLLDYTKSVVAVLVTVRLLLWLRQDRPADEDQASSANSSRNTKLIVLGLVIGFAGPLLLFWIITAAVM